MNIIFNDDYALMRLYVPIIMMAVLIVMVYFHRHHALKYLYLVNIFCYLAAVLSYFVLINHPVGEEFPAQWMNVIPFVWLIGIFGGYSLSFLSVGAFVVEHAKSYTWASVALRTFRVGYIVLCIIGLYFLILGILSLKSG